MNKQNHLIKLYLQKKKPKDIFKHELRSKSTSVPIKTEYLKYFLSQQTLFSGNHLILI